jgi:hypothetical protein
VALLVEALRYDKSREVVGSNPDGAIGIFYLLNPSGRTMALNSVCNRSEYQGYLLGCLKAAGA